MEIHAILTSSSFSNRKIKSFFEALVKKRSYSKAAIVTTAHPKKEKAVWNATTANQFKSMGLDYYFVDFELGEVIKDNTDVVYVCGGNTFRLLKFAREVKFKEQIEDLFNSNGIYFGSSAGSIILSPDISVAAEISPDKNIFELRNLAGLGFIDFHVVPHYTDDYRFKVQQFEKRHKEPVEVLRDGEAIYIKDSYTEKITQ